MNENGTSALAVTPFNGVFQDGSTFVYTSPLLGSIESVSKLTPDTMPGGLQIDLIGINRFEQPITNVWIILFINDCTYFPILNINDNIGWTTLVSLPIELDLLFYGRGI